jgi:hypothetical protein
MKDESANLGTFTTTLKFIINYESLGLEELPCQRIVDMVKLMTKFQSTCMMYPSN